MSKVAFFIETREGKIKSSSFEAATVARKIASETGSTPVGIAVGSGFSGDLDQFGEYGIAEVTSIDNNELSLYTGEGYASALKHEIDKIGPDFILMIASAMGKDLAPRLAVKLDTELISDITDYKITDNKIESVRPVFAGKALITLTSSSSLQFVSLRPKVFIPEKDAQVSCTISNSDFSPGSVTLRDRVKEVLMGAADKIDLTEADIIVSAGRGIQGPENFNIVEELASVLGAAVGASRAVVDAGWRPHSDQVGQTGKTVTPVLYIALGISGAIQHLAGMSSSKCIVAVNKDPDAPIFQIADYGIVADLFDIVPVMTEEFKKILV
ncbi:electron transfer flavoprotein subunit alpha/FixB family protein [candidate division KSB1 bacterium]